MPTVYSKKNAAKALGISLSTLNKYHAMEKVPHRRIGDRILFTESDLAAFLDICAVPATYPPSEREKLEMTKRAKEVRHENTV